MLTRDLRDSLTKQLTQVELLSYLGGAVSMAAATFIVFSALSMGVSERQRGLATLRAIGATRRQVGALVVSEGLLLCGSGALIGAPLGVMCVGGLAWWFSEIFVAGVAVSWGGLALGVFGTLLAALAASLLPAWQATRVQALEAMAPSAIPPSARLPWVVAVIGAVLVAIDPFLFFGPIDGMVGLFGVANVPQTAAWLRLVLHFVLGLPAMFIGAFLLAPVLVKLIEFLLAGPVARVLSISPMLLRQQLSTGLWRAAGTASALMVGLAVLVVLQVQGHSALSGWRLPTRFPDLFLYYSPSASSDQAERIASALPATQPTTQPAAARKEWTPWELLASRKPAEPPATATRPATAPTTQPERPGLLTRVAGTLMGFRPNAGEADSKAGVLVDDLAKIRTVPGVAGGRVMPVAIASPDFGHGLQSLVLTMASPNATMYFGIDPAVAFDMMELEFRDGDPASAKRFLTDGQAVWLKKDQTWRPRSELVGQRDGREVPLLRGLIVDDGQIAIQGLVTQSNGRHFIATPGGAVYEVPSEQVDRTEHGLFLLVTNEFKELRGIGVGDPFALKRVKDRKSVSFTAVGVIWSPGLDVITGVMDLGRQMEQRTAFSVFGSIRDAREQFGVDRVYVFGVNLDPGANPQTVVKEINRRFGSEGLRAGDVRAIKEAITTAFDRLLLLTSTVAFAALAVASLGVTNTVMASIRSRRWQFGVLRSIGVTRGQLLRLVLAEAILLGVVATALGLLVGSLMVTDARALQLLMTGYRPPIALPIWTLLIGISAVLLVALVASFWPARTVARTEPLKLLQAGRASA
jgi:ABC-type antimicrobial peptide transport system permease subunit